MCQRLLALVRRQSVFDEGAQLVRVWMLPGLYEFAHGRLNLSSLEFCGCVRARLIEERISLRSLQQTSKVYFNIARISAKRLFSGSFAEAAGLKIVQQLLSQIGDQPFQPAADSSFVNMKDARDLQQSLSIKKIRREQEAIFGRESLKRLCDGMSEVL